MKYLAFLSLAGSSLLGGKKKPLILSKAVTSYTGNRCLSERFHHSFVMTTNKTLGKASLRAAF